MYLSAVTVGNSLFDVTTDLWPFLEELLSSSVSQYPTGDLSEGVDNLKDAILAYIVKFKTDY